MTIADNPVVREVTQEIVNLVNPQKVILFSYKVNTRGEMASFKICVVCSTDNKTKTEHNIYVNIDSPLCYDVIVYTKDEWEHLIQNKDSFVAKIKETGCVLHG